MDDRKSIEVPITPEMIQAATEILWESGLLEREAEGVDQLVVEEMLRAALALSSMQDQFHKHGG